MTNLFKLFKNDRKMKVRLGLTKPISENTSFVFPESIGAIGAGQYFSFKKLK